MDITLHIVINFGMMCVLLKVIHQVKSGDCRLTDIIYVEGRFLHYTISRDSNPGPTSSIRGFGIETFIIPGSHRDYVTTITPLSHVSHRL
jgi:hypothetical protein